MCGNCTVEKNTRGKAYAYANSYAGTLGLNLHVTVPNNVNHCPYVQIRSHGADLGKKKGDQTLSGVGVLRVDNGGQPRLAPAKRAEIVRVLMENSGESEVVAEALLDHAIAHGWSVHMNRMPKERAEKAAFSPEDFPGLPGATSRSPSVAKKPITPPVVASEPPQASPAKAKPAQPAQTAGPQRQDQPPPRPSQSPKYYEQSQHPQPVFGGYSPAAPSMQMQAPRFLGCDPYGWWYYTAPGGGVMATLDGANFFPVPAYNYYAPSPPGQMQAYQGVPPRGTPSDYDARTQTLAPLPPAARARAESSFSSNEAERAIRRSSDGSAVAPSHQQVPPSSESAVGQYDEGTIDEGGSSGTE